MKKNVTISAKKIAGENTRFWEAVGSDLLFYQTLTSEGKALLDRMEKNSCCRYVRCHYTFSTMEKWGVQVGGEVHLDENLDVTETSFLKINKILEEYVKRGIKPVLEYDFFPVELISGKGEWEPADWGKWRELLCKFTRNLLDHFGQKEVRSWYFEVWNEPDYSSVSTWPEFYKLYDVFVDAVTSVDDRLQVGGSASYHLDFLRGFYEHIVRGKNFVTGQIGTRIDFISYHIYAMAAKWMDAYPLIRPTVQEFMSRLMEIYRVFEFYPSLKDKKFLLNEWGVCANWFHTTDEFPDLEFRNSEFSALFLMKLVHCCMAMKDNWGFEIGMLLYWGFAGEAMDTVLFPGMRDLVTAGCIGKPILTAYEMLAMLGDHRIRVEGDKPGSQIGVMAAKNGNRDMQILCYHFNEMDDEPREDSEICVVVKDLPEDVQTVRAERFILDETHNNSYREWQRQGSPRELKDANTELLQEASLLTSDQIKEYPVENGSFCIREKIPQNSSALYRIFCTD